ncbi:hypothetical protein BUALT_Bualt11G0091300 [Buddleja alternifolia]|uniref:Uncharacterized protein n=1 Tax=Buddleja alternifolia TaxID=168488 RepID=A0AAV6X263_9LAMI|nr:hypothetical protein BUALT_Bualt11G0091300 [Buddleja alternifolia]
MKKDIREKDYHPAPESDISLWSNASNSARMSSEEICMVLKYYGLRYPEQNEKGILVEIYFGSPRWWPWEIMYYRGLKKGPISAEDYSRRIAQNEEFVQMPFFITTYAWDMVGKVLYQNLIRLCGIVTLIILISFNIDVELLGNVIYVIVVPVTVVSWIISSKTVLLHLGHLGSSCGSITYMRHLGQPTSTMDVASGLAERDSSDDTHELCGDVGSTVRERLGDSSGGWLALDGVKFNFRSSLASFQPKWRGGSSSSSIGGGEGAGGGGYAVVVISPFSSRNTTNMGLLKWLRWWFWSSRAIIYIRGLKRREMGLL